MVIFLCSSRSSFDVSVSVIDLFVRLPPAIS
jgi:hypothetical protein